ncbi:MAG TPA: sigma 54-interacting transcriptional regulator [Pyrinomonadaceae bacterium]|nr:sigma 54-interacting transcriptional regulator [Pyrinomonadaceae bacterium]
MKPRLISISGSLEGTTFALTGEEVSIGRDASNQLCINDHSVSRQHCLIRKEAGLFKIIDLESFNGTFVNGVPVGEQPLAHGDQVALGRALFLFLLYEIDGGASLSPVELSEDSPAAVSTIRLDRKDVLYLKPGAEAAALQLKPQLARDLNALLKISTALSSIRELEPLERRLLEIVLEAVPAERAAILLVRENSEELLTAFGADRSGAAVEPIRISRTVADEVLREGVAVLCRNVIEDSSFNSAESLRASEVQSLLCVPLTIRERVAGLIYLDTSNPATQFDESHLQLLAAVGGIASVAIENVQHVEWLQSENRRLHHEVNLEHNMIGESPRMREVYRFIERVAPTDSTLLIRGESGTGKELAAHAVHTNSSRSAKPFVAINCAVLSEALLESELFGHEKGAFTSAIAQKRGKLEIADGGTLFLDEVGELAPATQAKLLRVLQEREFERLGGTRAIRVDVRVIAATNRDLEEAIRQGSFRQDLYYRLNVISLTLPPLRERREDIPLLAYYFAAKYSKRCKRLVSGISTEARASLSAYDWPGNVRELENAIERAVVMGNTDVIMPDDLPESLLETGQPQQAPLNYHEAVNEMKRSFILKAVEQANGNFTEAARLMGIHPANLHRLIRTLNLRAALDNKSS